MNNKTAKKDNRKLNFIIPLVVYPRDIMVSFGETHDEVNKHLSKYNIELDEDERNHFDRSVCLGRTILFPTNQTLIRMKRIPGTTQEFGTLAHEIFHAASFILGRMGMPLQLEVSDEAYAYLIGYLTEEIYNKIHQK